MTTGKQAVITGIAGQDGSWLADFLLARGYVVYGLVQKTMPKVDLIEHLIQDPLYRKRIHIHYGDLLDYKTLEALLTRVKPREVYNLAGLSHVGSSFDSPYITGEVNGIGTVKLLEAVRKTCPKARVFQACSSEMYAGEKCPRKGFNENGAFHPISPYGVSKLYAFWSAKNYREVYGLYVSNGILFNHESERRGETFVTRKITRAVGRIKAGLQKELFLGNLDAKRDWGDAKEYVRAMWMMLQEKKPDDYVIATGKTYSVKQYLEAAFKCAGLDWKKHVRFDPMYLRPSEVDVLIGNASKARRKLGWRNETTFEQLVKRMVEKDIELARNEMTRGDKKGS